MNNRYRIFGDETAAEDVFCMENLLALDQNTDVLFVVSLQEIGHFQVRRPVIKLINALVIGERIGIIPVLNWGRASLIISSRIIPHRFLNICLHFVLDHRFVDELLCAGYTSETGSSARRGKYVSLQSFSWLIILLWRPRF